MSVAENASADLFDTLVAFDGLDTFCLLPNADQQRFVSWVEKAIDLESYWARINALALAMRVGPLKPSIRVEPISPAKALG